MQRTRTSSTEEVFSRRADGARRGNLRPPILEASNDDHRITGGFAHEQSRRRGKFVGNSEDGGAKQLAVAIALAAKVEQRRNTGSADGYVGQAKTPRAAKCIADDHSHAFAGLFTESRSELPGRTVGPFRQKRNRVAPGNVGMVDTRVGADEAMSSFDNQHALGTKNAARLAKNYFDEAGIA